MVGIKKQKQDGMRSSVVQVELSGPRTQYKQFLPPFLRESCQSTQAPPLQEGSGLLGSSKRRGMLQPDVETGKELKWANDSLVQDVSTGQMEGSLSKLRVSDMDSRSPTVDFKRLQNGNKHEGQ